MSDFTTLGIADSASLDEVKSAYRKLAQKLHPDMGGDSTKFVEINAAYKRITQNWESLKQTQEKSAQKNAQNKKEPFFTAQKNKESVFPSARKIPIPSTYLTKSGFQVVFVLSRETYQKGGIVTFNHNGSAIDLELKPNHQPLNFRKSFSLETVIGQSFNRFVDVNVKIEIDDSLSEIPPKDHIFELLVSALVLFTGGKAHVVDSRKEQIAFSIKPGHDPSIDIRIPEKGFGSNKRGDIIIKLIPVFKDPKNFSELEKNQLQTLVKQVSNYESV